MGDRTDKRKKKILYVLAPNDRFNYGDLLFPHIIRHYFSKYFDELLFCSTSKSDLSKYGGIPTENLTSIYHASDANDNYLMVAGGDSLCINWETILSFIDPFVNTAYIIDNKLKTNFFLPHYIKLKYKIATKYPFSIGKCETNNFNKILYNSLGGSVIISNRAIIKDKKTTEILKSVDYFSVRDFCTYKCLKDNGISSYLAPDSAILMSDVFSEEFLINSISKHIHLFRNKKYIFFQINKAYAIGKEYFYANTIDNIYKSYQIPICLCPIGTASGHSDDQALILISKKIKTAQFYFIKKPNIYDIMWLIKNSKLYVGTSLHGTITAISFQTPYVAHGPSKLKNYLDTWENKASTFFTDETNIYATIQQQLQSPQTPSPEFQKKEIEISFSRMKQIING